jgi:hypothetical protein
MEFGASHFAQAEEEAPALNILTGGQKEKGQRYDLSVYRKLDGELNFHFRSAPRQSRRRPSTSASPACGKDCGKSGQLEIECRERGITVRAFAPLPRDSSGDSSLSTVIAAQILFGFGGSLTSLKLHRNVVGDCPTIRRKSRLNWVSD